MPGHGIYPEPKTAIIARAVGRSLETDEDEASNDDVHIESFLGSGHYVDYRNERFREGKLEELW